MPLPIAVLVSGGGSNLQSIIDRIEQGALDAEIRLVISNKAGAYGIERARKHGIPTLVLSHKDYPNREAFDKAMVDAMHKHGVTAPEGAVIMPGSCASSPRSCSTPSPAGSSTSTLPCCPASPVFTDKATPPTTA